MNNLQSASTFSEDVTGSTVHVVDDEEAMRNALSRLFRRVGLAAETYSGPEEFLDGYTGGPGCLLLDMAMPGMTGLALQQALNERRIFLPIVFLTGTADVKSAVIAMKAGALDLLEKPWDEDFLVRRVRSALALDRVQRAQRRKREEVEAHLARLTPREREVLDWVIAGKSSKEIGRLLGASDRTIEVHRRRIFDKMGVGTVPELVQQMLAVAPADPAIGS
jgi:two-component system, LuxR family, response regulator FixJ